MSAQTAELVQQARSVLNQNWRDGYTVPSSSLYPFQWHWDSGFIALGYLYFNLQRAQQEIRSLFKGQWKNGLLPHIIFHKEAEHYFPGPAVWRSNISEHAPDNLKTSGIFQPPVCGFILERMLQKSHDKQQILPFVEEIYPKVLRFHQYLYEHRDLHNEGLIYIRHNWESGMDNSPVWDEALQSIRVEETADLSALRYDNKNVAASERPSDTEYQKYLHLVNLFVKCNYVDAAISQTCPFLIQEPLMNSLLIRSNQALINLSAVLGKDAAELRDWNEASQRSMNEKLWNAKTHTYDAFDLNRNRRITSPSSAGLIAPLFARVPGEKQAHLMWAKLQQVFAPEGTYLCPSFMPGHKEFEPQRYWRGPVWINMNWMLYHGLADYGFQALADRVKRDSIELITKFGFYEYFDPRKSCGKGYGTNRFSWSAALFLDMIQEETKTKGHL